MQFDFLNDNLKFCYSGLFITLQLHWTLFIVWSVCNTHSFSGFCCTPVFRCLTDTFCSFLFQRLMSVVGIEPGHLNTMLCSLSTGNLSVSIQADFQNVIYVIILTEMWDVPYRAAVLTVTAQCLVVLFLNPASEFFCSNTYYVC